MDSPLSSYFSLQYDNEEEQKYISGLFEQFEVAKISESYHLALFAYHLLFICYFYQTLHKLKIWMPEQHRVSMVSFDRERREKFRRATNPTDYAHNSNHERSFFEFLNVFCDCGEVVAECKDLVDYRNNRLGHVNYLLVSKESFEEQIKKYDLLAYKIHKLTHENLAIIFDNYFKSLDPQIQQTKDDLEINLVSPNKLSDKDLECLAAECIVNTNPEKAQLSKILQEDFNVYVEET